MTSTNTPGAGISRLLSSAAVLALLLFTAGAADAQTRIFVDSDNGVETNTGANAGVTAGNAGPVRSLDRALEVARQSSDSNIISIEAGNYSLTEDIGDNANEFNLAFEARPDPNGGDVVVLDLGGNTRQLEPNTANPIAGQRQFQFLGAGGTFRIQNGSLDFQNGNIALGAGLVEFDIDEIEVTNAAVTGTPDYDEVPTQFTFNGTTLTAAAVNPSGNILPAIIDADGSDINIDVTLTGTLTNVNTQLGDDGGEVDLFVGSNSAISGSISIRDGNGTAGATVELEGDGVFGDVTVGSGASVEVEDDPTFTNFAQTGGDVVANNSRAVLTTLGGFDRSGGTFDDEFIIAFAGTSTDVVTFAPGPQFDITGLRVLGRRTVQVGAGNSFDIIGAGATINDPDLAVGGGATLDLNGGSVTIAGNRFFTPDPVTNLNTVQNSDGGVVIVDGQVTNGTIVFAGLPENNDEDPLNDIANEFAATLGGDGVVDDVRVDRNVNLAPTADVNFVGTLFLIDGSVIADDAQVFNNGVFIGEITGDISPEGDVAAVVVDITNDGLTPRIIEDDTDGDGTNDSGFNDDNNLFDLTYIDDRPNTDDFGFVGEEFSPSNVRDFTVDIQNGRLEIQNFFDTETPGLGFFAPGIEGGFIQGDFVVRDGRRRGGAADSPTDTTFDPITGTFVPNTRIDNAVVDIQDVFLGVLGDILIEDDAVVQTSFNGALIATSANNQIAGTFSSGAFSNGLVLGGDGVVITGAGDVSGAESDINGIIFLSSVFVGDDDVDARIENFTAIDAAITDGSSTGNTLEIALLNDVNLPGTPPEEAGNLNGRLVLNGTTVILDSGVHVTAAGFQQIDILNVGDNTFFVEGASDLELGGDVIGLGAVWLATGFGVVDDANGDGVVDLSDGDLDGDGDVDGADAAIAQGIIFQFDSNQDGVLDGQDEVAGDLDGDGDVTLADQEVYDLVANVVAPTTIVTIDDLIAIAAASNGGVAIADGDLDSDGDVDQVDQALFDIADVDNDGQVDSDDADRVAAADPDGNGDVDTGGPGPDLVAGDPNIVNDPNAVDDGTAGDADTDGFDDSDIDQDGDVDAADQLIFNVFDIASPGDVIDSDDTQVFVDADGNGDGQVATTGDINGDGFVNARDQAIVNAADTNDDGDIDPAQDVLAFANADTDGDGILDAIGNGDVDLDGDFDAVDRQIIARALLGLTESNTINLRAQADVDEITIPTFHPGDE
ncbi:beta strand repeat-containing protein, partial [Rubrivirga sp.]|uniref:beta strand repeat-containing protein n=1 Tax=Rubrivirga sp. TaxID=1885344 RepID=UPI003C7348F9